MAKICLTKAILYYLKKLTKNNSILLIFNGGLLKRFLNKVEFYFVCLSSNNISTKIIGLIDRQNLTTSCPKCVLAVVWNSVFNCLQQNPCNISTHSMVTVVSHHQTVSNQDLRFVKIKSTGINLPFKVLAL